MTINKNLSLLAGSVMLASVGAQAATVAPSNFTALTPGTYSGSEMMLLLTGPSGDLTYSTGVNADTLKFGGDLGFSVDLNSAAAADITAFGGLGAATGWALFGVTGGTYAYSYVTESYLDDGIGVVYARGTAGPFSGSINFDVGQINDHINATNATAGDLEVVLQYCCRSSSLQFGGLINAIGSTADLFWQRGNGLGGLLQDQVIITTPGVSSTAYVNGTTFFVSSEVPVPATAWLFGSALLGLGVVGRKTKL